MTPATELAVVEQDARVQEMSAGALALLTEAQSITITDAAGDHAACDFILNIKAARKRADELRHWFTDPLEAQKKAIISRFKDADLPLAEAEKIVGEKHLAWDRLQREIARKKQERAELVAKRKAEKALAAGRETPVVIPLPTVAAPPKTVRTASGSLTTRTEWRFEVLDPTAIPAEYLTPDLVKIGKVVRAGVREIPGLRIYAVETLGGRS